MLADPCYIFALAADEAGRVRTSHRGDLGPGPNEEEGRFVHQSPVHRRQNDDAHRLRLRIPSVNLQVGSAEKRLNITTHFVPSLSESGHLSPEPDAFLESY